MDWYESARWDIQGRETSKKTHREDKEYCLAYRDEPPCHPTAGRMPGGLACCAHVDLQPVLHQPCSLPPTDGCVLGIAKSGAFSISKGQNIPLLSHFIHPWCSGRPVSLLCYINDPLRLLRTARTFLKPRFHWGPLFCSLCHGGFHVLPFSLSFQWALWRG